MAGKKRPERAIGLAMDIAFRTALLGIPTVEDLRRDYGVSRATAYRYRKHVTLSLYRRAEAVKAAA